MVRHTTPFVSLDWSINFLPHPTKPSVGPDWANDFLPRDITEAAVLKAVEIANRMPLCPYRLWNFVRSCERQHVDLPALLDMIRSFRCFDVSRLHTDCSEEFCHHNNAETLLVGQLHKCPAGYCQQGTFPLALLHDAVKCKQRMAWCIKDTRGSGDSDIVQSVSCNRGEYLAVSHLWADGTGGGMKKAGCVNQSLTSFFAAIALSLGCSGVWWDAISLSLEKDMRRNALNVMHHN
jgi:hypothetical protein